MSRNYKNILKIREKSFGKERRENLMKEVLQDNTPIPKPLVYEDIDEEFRRWVEEDLEISFENEKLPTFMLLTGQRFSEYLQSWEHVDDKKNLILNFKTITRENNPQAGTLNGQTRNIPGNIDFLMKRVMSMDRHGNRYFIDYRVKQPISIDLIYNISIFTNKFQLLNDFNLMMNEKFKAINCYIRPNGHFIPMKLSDISDESEYTIDGRRYFSQSYKITVMAYIMPEDSFSVVEQPYLKLESIDGLKLKPKTTLEEVACDDESVKNYEYADIVIKTIIPKDSFSGKFAIDCNSEITRIEFTNVRYFEMTVNGVKVDLDSYFIETEPTRYKDGEIDDLKIELKANDVINFRMISRYKSMEDSEIRLYGKDFSNSEENS